MLVLKTFFFTAVLLLILIVFKITSSAIIAPETFDLLYEDMTPVTASITYYQMTTAESKQLDYVIVAWCKRNNPSSTKFLTDRATNYILRLAPYRNDGLKCFSPYGVLNGSAVCMGYSLFLKRILDYKKIDNQLVYDRVNTHMYNIVEGKEVDITAVGTSRKAWIKFITNN